MKNYKKILAGVLATSMVLGNSAVVFADEGGQAKGSGKVEGQVKTEVFSVVLPTESDYAGAFDYIIDPMQLIANDAGNNGNKYDKSKYKFEPTDTVFFYNGVQQDAGDSNKEKLTYTGTSNKLAVENKSSKPVDVTISLKASEVEGITFNSDSTFASDTNTSLYLGIVGSGYKVEESGGVAQTPTAETITSSLPANTEKISTNGTAQIKVQLPELKLTSTAAAGGSDIAFVTQWNPIRNAYEYVASAKDKATIGYEFQVEGKCNTNAGVDWLDVLAAGETPELEIMWSIEDPTGAQVEIDQTNKEITVSDLTPEQGFVSLTLSDGKDTYDVGGATDSTWDTSGFIDGAGTCVITYADWWNDWMANKLMTLTLTLTDGSTRTETFIGTP